MAASSSAVKSEIRFAIAPTIDEVVRVCAAAFARAKALRAEKKLDCASTMSESARSAAEREVYSALAEEFRDLCTTYPAVVAAMVAGEYNERAVRKFFKYVRAHPWKTEEDFFEVQSAYTVILHRATAPTPAHASGNTLARLREQTRSALADANRELREQIECAQKAADEINRARARARVDDLRARIAADRDVLARPRELRVSFDDDDVARTRGAP